MRWGNIPVLCFHDVSPVKGPAARHVHAIDTFERSLDLIGRLGFSTIRAADLREICLGRLAPPRRPIVLTFDDGFVGQWLYAAPALARRGMRGVFFVVTDWLHDGPVRTSVDAAEPLSPGQAFHAAAVGRNPGGFLRRSEARALVQDLGMEVYAHSAAHRPVIRSLVGRGSLGSPAGWAPHAIYGNGRPEWPVFRTGSAYVWNGYEPVVREGVLTFARRTDGERSSFCLEDFRRSLGAISGVNGADVQFLCWPWGAFDELATRALREAGYHGAFTLERTPNRPGTDPFRIGRVRVRPGRGLAWLAPRLVLHATVLGAALQPRRFRKAPDVARVLYVSDAGALSGGSRQIVNNVRALVESRIGVTVAVPARSPLATAAIAAGADVVEWDRSPGVVGGARRLAALARSVRADVVHACHPSAVKAAALARLFGLRARVLLNRGVVSRPNPLWGLFVLLADGAICNSAAAARGLAARFVTPARVNVIYNSCIPWREDAGPGAECGMGTMRGSSSGAGRAAGTVRVVWVGNAGRVKGIDIFAAAVRRLQDDPGSSAVEFIALGLGRDDQPPEIAASAGGSVKLVGHVSHGHVRATLRSADVFVLTSRRESLPNVVIEAFDAGLPVVATDVGGLRELIRDGVNGWLCPPGDAAAIADRVGALAADPEMRARMGRLNRALVQATLGNGRKGVSLLRVYCGDLVREAPPATRLEALDSWNARSGRLLP